MKTSILGFITLALIALSSCAPYTGSKAMVDKRPDMTALPNNFSLFDLARTISRGSVDVFDPWLTTFALSMDSQPDKKDGFLTFPEHPYLLIRDNSVKVYTLRDSNFPAYNTLFNMMDIETINIPPAVPLIEEDTH